MHELSLAVSLLETLERAALAHGFRAVKTVLVEVGELACVDGEALRTALQAVAGGTLLEGAAIELHRVSGRLRCRYCETAFAAAELHAVCPGCGRYGARIIGGDDARLAAVDVLEAAGT